MRSQPQLQVIDNGDGVVEYSVTSKTGWLSFGWLDLLLLGWCTFLHFDDSKHVRSSWLLALLSMSGWWILKVQTRRQESLLVMRAMGVQLASRNVLRIPSLWGHQIELPLSGTSKTFVPASSIQDVVLLEGIQGWSVVWYLAIAQQESDTTKLHVIFPHALPRLAIIREVWQGARRALKLQYKTTV